MFKSNKRSIRRHHRERLKKRARFIITKIWLYDENQTWAKWAIQRKWNNMKSCSCVSCCNQRRGWGKNNLTLQEHRNNYNFKDFVDLRFHEEDDSI